MEKMELINGKTREGPTLMGFAVFFAIAWLTVFTFYSMSKSLSIVENSFVYLLILTININIAWVVAEELNLMELTKEALPYAGLLIYRSVILPMIFVILFNAVYKAKSTAMIMVAMGAALAVILALIGLLRAYDIVTYTKWNLFYDLIQFLLMQAVSYALLKWYRGIVHREVKVS